MAKRLTKKQRENRDRDTLKRCVHFIGLGASMGESCTSEFIFMGSDLARFITALKSQFKRPDDQSDFRFDSHCIDEFDTVEKATAFLFDTGTRA